MKKPSTIQPGGLRRAYQDHDHRLNAYHTTPYPKTFPDDDLRIAPA